MAIAPKLEPEWSDGKVEAPRYLGVLLLGPPKGGKSSCAVGTAPGPVYVINSDGRDGLVPVQRLYPHAKFASNNVYTMADMENALTTARSLVKEGKVKTVVWDTMSNFAEGLELECDKKCVTSSGQSDGRRYWPMYTKFLVQTVARLRKIDAHIIVCSHFVDTRSSEEDLGAPKVGPSIVPLLAGKARLLIGKEFSDVLFLDRDVRSIKKDRVLRTSIGGVWGPGGRNTDGDLQLAPDIKEFMKVAGFKNVGSK